MALISTLREKMTKFVVGAITLSLGAFIVGSDLLGNGPRSIFGGSDRMVGEIGGDEITIDEYNSALQEQENNYIINFGRQPGERERSTLQSQAWELLIARHAIQPQYDKAGIKVGFDEVWDMIQGKNMDEGVRSAFLDSAGQFDRPRLFQYIEQVERLPATDNGRLRWDMFKDNLKAARERIKYENLIVKTAYVTEAEAEQDYHDQNDVAEVKYLYVPFFAISDSSVKVADADLREYYNKNKEKYKVENTRSLSYVAFPVAPSAADTLASREELDRLMTQFKSSTEDSIFASVNSEGLTPFSRYTASNLPAVLNDQRSTLTPGQVIGPVLDGGKYYLYKISRIGKDTVYNAKASHILIKWDDTTPEAKKAAKEKARKILNDIRGGADFAAKAREFGTDGTASRGGDLGWFARGAMVKPFDNAVFDAKKPGLLADLVETEFGYHIIDVTAAKDNTYYGVAIIEHALTASDETLNGIVRKADAFASDISGLEEFKAKAKKDSLLIYEANDLGTAERRINNLGESRQVVTWLFREAKVGTVSSVFDLNDNYIVAIMTGEIEKGVKPFEKVKEEITPVVTNQIKGKSIAEKLKGKTESLDELAKLFGKDAVVQSVSDLKINAPSMAGPGFDPVIIGAMFSVESGKRTPVVVGENGVVVGDVQNRTTAPAIGDFSIFKSQLLQNLINRGGYYVTQTLKDGANIDDKRYKFF